MAKPCLPSIIVTSAADGVGREDDGRYFGVAGIADRRSSRQVRHKVGDWARDNVQAGGNQGNFSISNRLVISFPKL